MNHEVFDWMENYISESGRQRTMEYEDFSVKTMRLYNQTSMSAKTLFDCKQKPKLNRFSNVLMRTIQKIEYFQYRKLNLRFSLKRENFENDHIFKAIVENGSYGRVSEVLRTFYAKASVGNVYISRGLSNH